MTRQEVFLVPVQATFPSPQNYHTRASAEQFNQISGQKKPPLFYFGDNPEYIAMFCLLCQNNGGFPEVLCRPVSLFGSENETSVLLDTFQHFVMYTYIQQIYGTAQKQLCSPQWSVAKLSSAAQCSVV